MGRKTEPKWPVRLISFARAFTVGLAYYSVHNFPGLTSSFVAIFVALLPFDLMVAMPNLKTRWAAVKQIILVVIPRISATALTLLKGLLIGIAFGTITRLGLPVFFGAVLTAGLGYSIAVATKGNISGYVGMIAGLSVFGEIVTAPLVAEELLGTVLKVSLIVSYGTFGALLAGWGVGLLVGILTRLCLPRGYRYLKSSAYDQPLEYKPFNEVMGTGDNMTLVSLTVQEGSEFAWRTLAQIAIKERFYAHVLSIQRGHEHITSPGGKDYLLPHDEVVIWVPKHQVDDLLSTARRSKDDEQEVQLRGPGGN